MNTLIFKKLCLRLRRHNIIFAWVSKEENFKQNLFINSKSLIPALCFWDKIVMNKNLTSIVYSYKYFTIKY